MDKRQVLLKIQDRIEKENIKCNLCEGKYLTQNEMYVIPIWDEKTNTMNPEIGLLTAYAICQRCGQTLTFNIDKELL